jgi:tetratricopeptide (TPR) repeat protein
MTGPGQPPDAQRPNDPPTPPDLPLPNPATTPPAPLERTVADVLPDTAATISTATAGGGHAVDRNPSAPQVTEPALSGPGPRFTLAAPLGRGATSQVWAAHDHDFDRDVAIKHLAAAPGAAGSRGRFLHEARLTASLDHPNIVPVYDLGADAEGGLYLVMRRIAGKSLGDRIRAAIAAGRSEIAPINEVVTIFLKLCDALAFAHAKGILHRDIKPDNIMLGDFGEVVMVDWGTASEQAPDAGFRSLVGTPAYMAPEQSRGALAGEPGDVYSLGASLFHALFLRHPLRPGGEPEQFWTRKRAGAIDEPTAAECARVPRHLLAILLKAMAADPAARYPAITALAADLRRWQAGLAVSAMQDNWLVRLARWHRRRARVLWPAAAAVLLVAALALYAYGQRLEEIASWGSPVVSEDFADDSWITRWTPTKPGSFTARHGTLVSRGERESFLICNRRFSGSVAVEFDGLIPPGTQPCDLSVVWTDTDCFATSPPKIANPNCRMIFLQTGAEDNLRAMILAEPDQRRLAASRMKLETGRTYHIRAVLDGTHLELAIDGKVLCTYDDVFPFTSGYLALYAYYPGKTFSHLRIYNKGVAQKVPALAIGDAFYQEGSYASAAAAYQHLIDSQPGTAQADDARFRLGLSRMVEGRWDLAQAAWRTVQDPDLQLQVRIHGLDHAVKVHDFTALGPDFLALYADHPHLRALLRTHWCDWVGSLWHENYREMAPLIAIQEQAFPDHPDTNETAAVALGRLGRWQDAADRFAHDDLAMMPTLFALGRYDEMMEPQYADARILHFMARFETGAFTAPGFESEARQYSWSEKDLLLCTGRFDDYRRRFGDESRLKLMHGDADAVIAHSTPEEFYERIVAHWLRGEGDQAMAIARAEMPHLGPGIAMAQLIRLGRGAEAIPLANDLSDEQNARAGAALDARIAGDTATATRETGALQALPWAPIWRQGWFTHVIALPFLQQAAGDHGAVQASLARWAERRDWNEERPWWFVQAVLGRVSDADYLNQPYRVGAPGTLAIARGIRHELAGEREAALAAYRSFGALPPWQRGIEGMDWLGDPTMDRFVAWRLHELDGAAGVSVPVVDGGAATAAAVTAPATAPAPAP